MSQRKQRQLWIMLSLLAGVLLLLAGALLLSREAKKSEQDGDTPVLTALSDVSEMTLTNAGTSLTFVRSGENSWYWADDKSFPVDGSVCEEIAKLAESCPAERELPLSDTLEAYGLAQPERSLRVTNDAGEQATILIGIQTGEQYYAMVQGADVLYTVNSTLPDDLGRSLYDLAELADYPALSSDVIQSVTVRGAREEAFTVHEVAEETQSTGDSSAPADSSAEPASEKDNYHWFRADKDVTDEELTTRFRTELDQISMDRLVNFKPDAQQRKEYGLDSPTAVLTVTHTLEKDAQTVVLTLGAYDQESDSYYCVLDTHPDEVYQIAKDKVAHTVSLAEKGFDAAARQLDAASDET